MTASRLHARGVIRVSGEDATAFLNGLVTADVERLADGGAAAGALLTPQGKILFDFLIHRRGGEYLIDVERAAAAALVKRLGFYRLRAKVAIEDASGAFAVVADPGSAEGPADPRASGLGLRDIVEAARAPAGDGSGAHAERRVSLGIAECGPDFASGEVFPHEANHDLLHGVSLAKGCYVGQEVVSRMHHRGTARKRFLPCRREGAAPAPGTEVTAAGRAVGTAGSSADGGTLALLRLDRIGEALAGAAPLTAGEARLWPAVPDWAAGLAIPGEGTGEAAAE